MKGNIYSETHNPEGFELINPSSEYKKARLSVVLSIAIFFVFYLFLIAISGVFTVASGWLGFELILQKSNFLTTLAGASLLAMSVIFLLFLFKFILSRTKDENPDRIQILENEYPELFSFIRALARETQAKMPKKIYISPDVNARVFYNSNFWSILFPVRKNLEIGLGLVNTLNISEFKSVLAHEFGHFSQRCMKLGGYIYTVNKVIYNLIYEYDIWDLALAKWIQSGGILGVFSRATYWLVERVRNMLKVAYSLVNLNYLKLSREMEYHADLVAISVTGNEVLKKALRKIEFSLVAYEYALDSLNALALKKKASYNIYSDHQFTLNFLADNVKIGISKKDFEITDDDLINHLVRSKINVEDQWASHPSYWDREKNIDKFTISCSEIKDPAWKLFSNAEELQKSLSKKLYGTGCLESKFEDLSRIEFQEFVKQEANRFKISEKYKGFYNSRFLTEFNPADLLSKGSAVKCFNELYSLENVELIKRLDQNMADLQLLKQIRENVKKIYYFEFDGVKRRKKDAKELIKYLRRQIDNDEKLIEQADKDSFILNYQAAAKAGAGDQLVQHYETYFAALKQLKAFNKIYDGFQNLTNTLCSASRWSRVELAQMITELCELEREFKRFLKLNAYPDIFDHLEQEQKEILRGYITTDATYLSTEGIDQQALFDLTHIVSDIQAILGTEFGKKVKNLTDYQLQFHDITNR